MILLNVTSNGCDNDNKIRVVHATRSVTFSASIRFPLTYIVKLANTDSRQCRP